MRELVTRGQDGEAAKHSQAGSAQVRREEQAHGGYRGGRNLRGKERRGKGQPAYQMWENGKCYLTTDGTNKKPQDLLLMCRGIGM